jgi:hypothetical protein
MNAISSFFGPPGALEMRIQWKPTATRRATFASGLDLLSRTVRMQGGGVWKEDDAARYFDEQKHVLDEARKRFGPLKVFVDLRDWIVESPDSAFQFQEGNRRIFTAGDRIVAVVKSSILKPHPRAALSVGSPEVFVSMEAAETWLQAYSNEKCAA